MLVLDCSFVYYWKTKSYRKTQSPTLLVDVGLIGFIRECELRAYSWVVVYKRMWATVLRLINLICGLIRVKTGYELNPRKKKSTSLTLEKKKFTLKTMTKINETNIWKLVRKLTQNTTISSLIPSRSYLVLSRFTHEECRRFF